MTVGTVIAVLLALGLVLIGAVAVVALVRARGGDGHAAAVVERVSALSGRLEQMAVGAAAGQAELRRAFDERLDAIAKRVGDTLTEQGRHHHSLLEGLKERLAVIDQAQKNITELSGQVVGLQDVLANKQARGAFGEIQLNDLVSSILPPSAYRFQAPVGEGRRADCLLMLPNPPGAIAVDAKFPLESYHALRTAEDDAARIQARRGFRDAILKHVADIAERYIVPGETAESALMFVPSEAVYAELHANFPEVVERSFKARVWIVSPTTLMATLNTVRAVLKDAHMREQAGVIQDEVLRMLGDVARLAERVDSLEKHFEQANKDVRQIRTSADKITGRGERITQLELGQAGEQADATLAPPEQRDVAE
ncbi:MAG TPA: DNA recombination protein RmuC [Alphaproteobacteria bacterium]